MKVAESMLLSPWEKWKRYGKFPWKFAFHLFLLILSTSKVMLFTQTTSGYVNAAHRNWLYFFVPHGIGTESGATTFLFTIEEVRNALETTTSNYYTINETSIAGYEHVYPTEDGSKPSPVTLVVVSKIIRTHHLGYATNTILKEKYNTTTYILGKGELGPLSRDRPQQEISDFFKTLVHMRMIIHLHDWINDYVCVGWKIRILYDFSSGGTISSSVEKATMSPCAPRHSIKTIGVLLNVVLICCSLIYQVLLIKAIVSSYSIYQRAKRRHKSLSVVQQQPSHQRVSAVDSIPWGKIPLSVKMRFFSGWQLLAMLANTILLLCGVLDVRHEVTFYASFMHKMYMGMGALLLWVGLVGYMEENTAFYSVVNTIRLGLPRVLKFLVGVTPIFLGYSLFGVAVFGDRCEKFSTVKGAMVYLFAVLNGDSIRDSFTELMPLSPLVAQIYLYSFVCVFMYVVLNMYIAIMEEAFIASQKYQRPIEKYVASQSQREVFAADKPAVGRSKTSRAFNRDREDEERADATETTLREERLETYSSGALFRELLIALDNSASPGTRAQTTSTNHTI